MERDPLLSERQQTHGSFEMNAIISQRLKKNLRMVHPHYDNLSDVHKEAIDMICLKLSRIMSGQASFHDHWDDIAGYAKLGSEGCALI